jgi:hypothetical protein
MKIGTLVRYLTYTDVFGQTCVGAELCIILGDVRQFPHLIGDATVDGLAMYNFMCNYFSWEYREALLNKKLYEVLAE